MPLDVVVIYLGTNDAGDRYSLPAQGRRRRRRAARARRADERGRAGPGGAAPAVLVVCPPPFGRLDPEGSFAHAGEKSRHLGRRFAEVCELLGCELIDLDGIASYSDLDGIHLEAEGHAAVAVAVEQRVRALFV